MAKKIIVMEEQEWDNLKYALENWLAGLHDSQLLPIAKTVYKFKRKLLQDKLELLKELEDT